MAMSAIDNRKPNGLRPPVNAEGEAEIRAVGEAEAQQWLGVSFEEALSKLDRGELAGTVAEDELRSLRRLLAL